MNCAGAVPGSVYVAPGNVVAATYNGILLRSALYTITGNVITLLFSTEDGDRIDAFCVA
jgi:hypothetical protein